MKPIRPFTGALLLTAAILASLALRHGLHSPEPAGESASRFHHVGTSLERSMKQRAQDPLRHRRLAERLMAANKGTAMTGEAGDGESDFRKLVDSFTMDDFASVMHELASLDHADDLRLKLLLAWSEREPQAAASFASAASLPLDASRVVAESWAKHDPAAALYWARGLPHQDQRQEALVGCGNELAFHHPQRAIELAIEAGSAPAAEDLLNQAAGAWAAKDPGAAVTWAAAIADTALREKLVTQVATAWADQDPHAASKLVLDSVNDGSLGDNALVGIVQRIALKDMANAREWVDQFPDGRLRERAEAELSRIAGRRGGSPLTSQQ